MNFDRFQIGDPMDDMHFACWSDEIEVLKDEDPQPEKPQPLPEKNE